LIEKGELKNSQVYKSSEGEVELTYVGSQLFCYWYDHYSELLENYEQGEKQDNLTIEGYPIYKLSTRTMIDPPSGWRFGFPKEIPKKVIEEEGVINWLVDNGYPQSEIDIFKDGLPYRIYEI